MGIFSEVKEREDIVTQPVMEDLGVTEKSDEIAVISSSTKIEGNITTEGHLFLNGNIEGNVSTKGNLVLAGSASGSIHCDSLLVEAPNTNSDISANENIIVKSGTTIHGNVSCRNITVMGTVLGDIEAEGSVVLKASSEVVGNITAMSIGIENGAKVSGTVKVQ